MNQLLAWQNLIFYIPIAIALLMGLSAAIGLGHDAEHDLDHDVDHDVDHDASHDAGHDHDGHGGGRTANALDGTPRITYRAPLWLKCLAVLGVGRVPITIVITTVTLIFGVTGVVANAFLAPVLKFPALYAWLSLSAALLCTVTLSGKVANLVSRLMPSTETYAASRSELVGQSGQLVLPANRESGLAQVKDRGGNLHQICCRTYEGELAAGSGILVVEHKPDDNLFMVEALPAETDHHAA